MSIELLISGIAVLCAIFGFLATYFGFIADLREKIGKASSFNFTDLLQRITTIEAKIATVNFNEISSNLISMKVKTDLFWGAIESVVRDLIKQPIHLRKDGLIDKFPNLTEEEMCELRDIITSEMVDLLKDKKEKALAYALMKARIDQILYDRNNNCVEKGFGLKGI